MPKGGLVVLLAFACGFTGCVLVKPLEPMAKYVKHSLTFRGDDYADPTEMEDEAWVSQVGEEARGDRPREKDPDPWFKRYFMSEKARSIERNVGID